MKCPLCGANCEAEFVDIGVGSERCTPWWCGSCYWHEELADFLDDKLEE